MESEVWKDILGYEGLYQVSNFGRVKSLGNEKSRKEKILKQKLDKGYCRIRLCKNGNYKYYRVNILVWEMFNGAIPEGMEVNHINEIKSDNRLTNLNLTTHKENCNWGTRNIRIINNRTGDRTPKPVIQYDLNNNFIKEWVSAREIQRQIGYSSSYISACCRGECKTVYGYKWIYKL